MTIKAIFYIVIDLLFVCVMVAAFIRSRKEAGNYEDNATDGGSE